MVDAVMSPFAAFVLQRVLSFLSMLLIVLRHVLFTFVHVCSCRQLEAARTVTS
jgi:hypothetical protein